MESFPWYILDVVINKTTKILALRYFVGSRSFFELIAFGSFEYYLASSKIDKAD